MTTNVSILLLGGALLAAGPGCGLVGPSCLARQHRGTAATLTGDINARAIAMHRVAYATEGSQNDVNITWNGQYERDGARLRVYATKVDCLEFVPGSTGGPCVNIGHAGGIRPCYADRTCEPDAGDFVQTHLIVTNGRGNPDILGSPAEYKLWVVGDSLEDTAYSMTITWFFGPDC